MGWASHGPPSLATPPSSLLSRMATWGKKRPGGVASSRESTRRRKEKEPKKGDYDVSSDMLNRDSGSYKVVGSNPAPARSPRKEFLTTHVPGSERRKNRRRAGRYGFAVHSFLLEVFCDGRIANRVARARCGSVRSHSAIPIDRGHRQSGTPGVVLDRGPFGSSERVVFTFPYPINYPMWFTLSLLPIAPIFSHPWLLSRARQQ